jgi:hypothetical protein
MSDEIDALQENADEKDIAILEELYDYIEMIAPN